MTELEILLVINRLIRLNVLDKHVNFTKAWMDFLSDFISKGKYVDVIAAINDSPEKVDNGTERMLKIFAGNSITPDDDITELARFMNKLRDTDNKDIFSQLLGKAHMQGKDKAYVEEQIGRASNKVRQL
jgi:hypothetical protein